MKTTLVYLRRGSVAHELPELASPNSFDNSLCGLNPWPDFWHGTGSQTEIERAASLSRCLNCKRVREGAS